MEFERKMSAKLIMSVIAAGLMSFCGVVVETSMNITFPTLMTEFGVGTATVQWITTGYLLILSLILPTSSFLNKRFSLKKLFVTAAILFIAGTVICAVAPTFIVLLLGRLIQGAGTGLALPLMYNIVLQQVPYENMGVMMGVTAMISGLAPAVGPSLGGLIVTNFGWRVIFWILLPVQVLALIMGIFCIRQSSELSKPAFDKAGYGIILCCFSALVVGASLAGVYGWGSVPVIVLLIAFAVLLAVFILHAKRSTHPLLNVYVFRYKYFVICLTLFVMIQFFCLAQSFLLPNFAQLVNGSTALGAGMVLLPGCLIMTVMGPISGRIYDKIGIKKVLLVGFSFMLLSQILFNIFIRSASTTTMMCIYLFFAFGIGICSSNAMTYGLAQLPDAETADGNAMFNTLQQLFGAVSTSIVSAIVAIAQNKTTDMAAGTIAGTANAFILLLVLAVAGMGLVFVVLRRKEA